MEEFLPQYIANISMQPEKRNDRENEEEEFAKYIELVEKLKNNGKLEKEIASYFLENNFEGMLNIKIDKRTEKEIEEDMYLSLSKITFPNNEDNEIEELKR